MAFGVGICKHGLREWWVNEGPMYTFVFIWMTVNVFLFVFTFNVYRGDDWTFLRIIVANGLPVARGAAGVLAFNCALILLPVCRNLVNASRGAFECSRSVRRLFDKNILFHKWCAYTICFFAAVHIVAHVFNITNLCESKNGNAAKLIQNNDTPITVLFTYLPGYTGILITVSLIMMVTTAVDQIRRSFFELFWYTHHLFIVFYISLMFHGYSGFVKKQTNFDEVPYFEDEDYLAAFPSGKCFTSMSPSTSGAVGIFKGLGCPNTQAFIAMGVMPGGDDNVYCAPGLSFNDTWSPFCCPCISQDGDGVRDIIIPGGPSTWKWVIGPFILYLAERFYRFYMSQTRPLQVLKIVKHNDNIPVMEVQVAKVKTKSGQYAFLHCPEVSALEWHPFTLTSCPRLPYISFHIRLVGDWTCSFAERCGFYSDDVYSVSQLPKVAIDGPFGTSSEDIFEYEVGICVCAGIGVTPFASLLQELFLRKFAPKPGETLKTRTVYFYWMCPGFDSWGWFASMLVEFEQQCIEKGLVDAHGLPDFLRVRVHMTRGWNKEDAEKLFLQDDAEAGDLIVRDKQGRGLKSKMLFGRPNWAKEFDDMTKVHHGKDIGIFFCGPKILSTTLHNKCNEFSDASGSKGHHTRFFYNKENF